MADVKLAGRIREHFKNKIFWPPRFGSDLEQPPFAPETLPFFFIFSEIVSRHA
jgi:hypothetical protein